MYSLAGFSSASLGRAMPKRKPGWPPASPSGLMRSWAHVANSMPVSSCLYMRGSWARADWASDAAMTAAAAIVLGAFMVSDVQLQTGELSMDGEASGTGWATEATTWSMVGGSAYLISVWIRIFQPGALASRCPIAATRTRWCCHGQFQYWTHIRRARG
jgi:hypothetical protein